MVRGIKEDKWQVEVSHVRGQICVEPIQGTRCLEFGSVYIVLTWIDKWRGISLKDKVTKEMKLCQNWCDKQNKKESMMNKICKEINNK